MREVYPLLILLFDEVELLLARPLLHRRLALSGELDVFKILLSDESNDIVSVMRTTPLIVFRSVEQNVLEDR